MHIFPNVEFGAVHKCVDLVGFVKSFPMGIYYLLEKTGVDTAENEPVSVSARAFTS